MRRMMAMDLANDGAEAVLGTFARYLAVLPNLHILEVIFVSVQYSRPLHKTLNSIKHLQIRTLFLPSVPHYLLRHRPNDNNLIRIPFQPHQEFVESLAAGI